MVRGKKPVGQLSENKSYVTTQPGISGFRYAVHRVARAAAALVILTGFAANAYASDLPPDPVIDATPFTAPLPVAADRPKEWAVTVLGGYSSPDNFTGILFTPWTTGFEDTQMVSLTVQKRIYEFWGDFFVDWEVGAGKRFGNSDAGEFWTTLYFRYDGFPWKDTIYMTAGVNTGLNYATSISALERRKSGNHRGSKLLHYFSPEITFAHPDNKDLELVTRLHHRSGAFGLFRGVSGGSAFVSIGIRQHF